jgi:hypothetical protein
VLLEIATAPPPVFDRVTVHVLDPADPRVVGAQASDVIVAGELRASKVDFEKPLRVAVMVAVWSPVAPVMVATKDAAVALGGTETAAGHSPPHDCS